MVGWCDIVDTVPGYGDKGQRIFLENILSIVKVRIDMVFNYTYVYM
jgi:hypothetical protein